MNQQSRAIAKVSQGHKNPDDLHNVGRNIACSDKAELQKSAPFERVGVFDFVGLPAELRNRIYDYVLDDVKPAFIRKAEAIPPRELIPLWGISLMQICRQIRAEYRPLYLSRADFTMYFGDARLLLDSFWPLEQDYRIQPKRFWLIYDDRDDRTLSEKYDILYLIQLSMHWDTLAAYLYFDSEPKIDESRLSRLIYNREHRPSWTGNMFGYPTITDSVGDFLNNFLHHSRLSVETTSMIDGMSDTTLQQRELWRKEVPRGNIKSIKALYRGGLNRGGTLNIFVELGNTAGDTPSTGSQQYLEDVGLEKLRYLSMNKSSREVRNQIYTILTLPPTDYQRNVLPGLDLAGSCRQLRHEYRPMCLRADVFIDWKDWQAYINTFFPSHNGKIANIGLAPDNIVIYTNTCPYATSWYVSGIDILPLIKFVFAKDKGRCTVKLIELEPTKRHISQDDQRTLQLLTAHSDPSWIADINSNRVSKIILSRIVTWSRPEINICFAADEEGNTIPEIVDLEVEQRKTRNRLMWTLQRRSVNERACFERYLRRVDLARVFWNESAGIYPTYTWVKEETDKAPAPLPMITGLIPMGLFGLFPGIF
ncbi:hypothetical protein E8E13_005277 [Curvularia kusanoi]|uniref:Uncharacterized protein n=1 Tax=Curvularia kusanoi TaxID=90978 RepID=A0A9P4T9R0_CURKU|nr:hypothetical protein E8E13_005277 [Curvularia kusanoi]